MELETEESCHVYSIKQDKLKFADVEACLAAVDQRKVSSRPPKEIRPGQIYVYKYTNNQSTQQWRDGFSWHYIKRSAHPEKQNQRWHREDWQLQDDKDGVKRKHNFYKRVFYKFGAKESKEANRGYTLVHYTGEIPKDLNPDRHGNTKTTPEKIGEIRKTAVAQGYTPGKTPVKYKSAEDGENFGLRNSNLRKSSARKRLDLEEENVDSVHQAHGVPIASTSNSSNRLDGEENTYTDEIEFGNTITEQDLPNEEDEGDLIIVPNFPDPKNPKGTVNIMENIGKQKSQNECSNNNGTENPTKPSRCPNLERSNSTISEHSLDEDLDLIETIDMDHPYSSPAKPGGRNDNFESATLPKQNASISTGGEEESRKNNRVEENGNAKMKSTNSDCITTPGGYASTSKSVKENLESRLKAGQTPKQALMGEIMEAARHGLETNPSLSPRNLKQAQNIAYNLRKSSEYRDDIFDMFNLTRTNRLIIYDTAAGGVTYAMAHPEMLKHCESVIQNMDNVVFHYDTTFSVGPFFTSILALRNPLFKKEPLTAVATMYHESSNAKPHIGFFRSLKDEMPSFGSKTFTIVSDREAAIRVALEQELPLANRMSCWNHMKSNIGDWSKKKYGQEASSRYVADVTTLLETESDEEYETQLAFFKKSWDQEFTHYYMTYNHNDVKGNNVGKLKSYGITFPEQGITNNPAESMNNALKNILERKECTFYEAAMGTYYYQCYLLLEIKRGLENVGDFKLSEQGKMQLKKIKSPENFHDVVQPEAIPDIITKGKYRKISEPPLQPDIRSSNTARDGIADYLRQTGRVECNPRFGIWTIREADRYYIVKLDPLSCTCTERKPCAHMSACQSGAGLKRRKRNDVEELRQVGNMEQVYKRTKSKRTGKKGKTEFEAAALRFNRKQGQAYSPIEEPNALVLGDIPKITMKNHYDDHVLELESGLKLRMSDWKTLQPNISVAEQNLLTKLDKTLESGHSSWLNDKIITAFGERLCDGTNCIFIPPTVSTLLLSDVQIEDVSEDYQKQLKAADWVFFPVRPEGLNHWILVALRPEEKQICVLDSLDELRNTDESIQRIVNYYSNATKATEIEEWDVLQYDDIPHTLDSSRNGRDCGVYVSFYMDQFVNGKELVEPLDPLAYRAKMLNKIVQHCNPFRTKAEKDVCRKCNRPDPSPIVGENRVDWINCDRCQQWYHQTCVNVRQANVACSTFVCSNF